MDLTKHLEAADRSMAISQPHLHPRPGPIRAVQRQADLRKMERNRAAGGGQKLGLLNSLRQMKAARALARPSPPKQELPVCGPSPDQRRRDEAVQHELQTDLTKAVIRGMRAVAGRWCDEDRASKIEQSPAVAELLSRTTGWVHSIPDVAKLAVVTGAKLL